MVVVVQVTHGAVIATTHRVKTPAGDKPRLSLPFFQEVGPQVCFSTMSVLTMVRARLTRPVGRPCFSVQAL